MGYKRANEILPQELLRKLQYYVDGEYIYIPRKEENKKAWGERTDTRRYIRKRNQAIYTDFCKGSKINELAERYFLTRKSIERIIRQEKVTL